jgi:predicted dehydrogenase
MTSDVTRRGFIKTAGTAAAGVAVATRFNPRAYAANEKLRVGMIGTGGQAGFHIRFGLLPNDEIEIAAVCDIFKPNLEAAWAIAGGENREIGRYLDYREMLDKADIDAVIVCTPLNEHYEPSMAALDAGKHLFLQKTMCFEIEECRDIVKKVHETGLTCQIGHQRRYNPEYNKAVWLSRGSEERQSTTGRINHIQAHWHRNNDWRRPVPQNYEISAEERALGLTDLERHVNWRLYPERSKGGLITELATHQLDVASWFLGAMPSRVSAFGGIDYWKDGRETDDNIVMIYEYDVPRAAPGFADIVPRNPLQRRAQINRDYTVRFTYSSICANAHASYGEQILGDRGSLHLTEQHGCTYYAEPAAREDWNLAAGGAADLTAEDILAGKTRDYSDDAYKEGLPVKVVDDKGESFENATVVDRMQFTEFVKDIRNGTPPKANEIVGLMAAVSGFAALESMRDGGRPVEIDPALYSFDFETPDPFRFDFFEDPDWVEAPI